MRSLFHSTIIILLMGCKPWFRVHPTKNHLVRRVDVYLTATDGGHIYYKFHTADSWHRQGSALRSVHGHGMVLGAVLFYSHETCVNTIHTWDDVSDCDELGLCTIKYRSSRACWKVYDE